MQDVSFRFVSRSKINDHWSRFETRARKHYYTFLGLYIQCTAAGACTLLPPSSLFFRQPFRYTHTYSLAVSRWECAWARVRGEETRKGEGGRMDSATRSWCNCMLIEHASEYGVRMEAVRFDIAFRLRSSSFRPSFTSSFVIWWSPPYSSRALAAVFFFPRWIEQWKRGSFADTAWESKMIRSLFYSSIIKPIFTFSFSFNLKLICHSISLIHCKVSHMQHRTRSHVRL